MKAVFLDRDGVLNEAPMEGGRAQSPRHPEDLVIAPEARTAVDRLHAEGFLLLVVTNQPEVARGSMTEEDLAAINQRLAVLLPIDGVYCCTHDNDNACNCRKPKPGLLLRAASEWGVGLSESWLIGDRWVDVAAAEAAGVKGILVERQYSWQATSVGAPPHNLCPVFAHPRLLACVNYIVGSEISPGSAT